jgi:hypothetical protein
MYVNAFEIQWSSMLVRTGTQSEQLHTVMPADSCGNIRDIIVSDDGRARLKLGGQICAPTGRLRQDGNVVESRPHISSTRWRRGRKILTQNMCYSVAYCRLGDAHTPL